MGDTDLKTWILFALGWFGFGALIGLAMMDLKLERPKPEPFPKGYGRQRIYYLEPKAINEYRFDI